MRIEVASRRVHLDPRDAAFVQDPYAAYAEIRACAPEFYWEQYGHWCLASHEGVAAALREPRFGRQITHLVARADLGWAEPEPGNADFDALERHSLLELEPPDHTRLRTLVNRAFVARRIGHLRGSIGRLAHRLIDVMAADASADLLDPFATMIPVTIIADLLGLPPGHERALLAWSHAMVAMYQFRRSPDIAIRANTAAREFSTLLRSVIAERRTYPGDDLISQLIAAREEGGRLSEAEMIATCVLLLNAGHEATVHAIGNGVKVMLESGLDLARCVADPPTLAATVEEILRFDAPLHMFTRYCLADFEWRGIALRRGDRIGLLLGAANRDPARFESPNRFDSTRTPNPHVSFGGGIHFCLGAPLARLELTTVLPILLQRLPGLRLSGPIRYRDTYHFRQLERLPVAW